MNINNPLIRKIFATVFAVLLLLYVVYQIYAVNSIPIKTETATYARVSDTIQTPVWVARNEVVLNAENTGVISYNVSDGEKVAKGGDVALIYASEDDATANSRIAIINDEINDLKSLENAKNFFSGSPDLIGSQISTSITDMLVKSSKNEYHDAGKIKSKLQYYLSAKKIILGQDSADNYANRISELEEEKKKITDKASGPIGTIKTDDAGYFISKVDGYENAFDMENIEDITVKQINSIKPSKVSDNDMGKIATDFSWYVTAVITEPQKVKLENSYSVKVEFPSVSGDAVPAEIVGVNKDPDSSNYALVLKCNYMNAGLSTVRNENANIIVDTYSGVLVNEKSIHFEDITTTETDQNGKEKEVVHKNVKGVYVKSAGKLEFVQIFSDATINGYAVCKLDLNDYERSILVTENTIELYDEVVTGGSDLYDGKLI